VSLLLPSGALRGSDSQIFIDKPPVIIGADDMRAVAVVKLPGEASALILSKSEPVKSLNADSLSGRGITLSSWDLLNMRLGGRQRMLA
jgi:hypothetical protein